MANCGATYVTREFKGLKYLYIFSAFGIGNVIIDFSYSFSIFDIFPAWAEY